jgi:hypothetical protein
MKTKTLFGTLAFMFITLSLFAQSQKQFAEVLYFHRTNRCPTCMSIEKNTKDLLESNYKTEMESEKVIFKSIDFQQEAENEFVKKYSVEGPTLLVIKHKKDKESKIDLTNEAFTYSRNNAEKFKGILQEKINICFR